MAATAIRKNDVIVINTDKVFDGVGNTYQIEPGLHRVCCGRSPDGQLTIRAFPEHPMKSFFVDERFCERATHTSKVSVYTGERVPLTHTAVLVRTVGELKARLADLPDNMPLTNGRGKMETVWTNIGRRELGMKEHLSIDEYFE